MIRFSQRIGCYIGIPLIPSTEILTAEDHRVFVTGREGLNCIIEKHPDPVIQHLPTNSRGVKQSFVGVTLQDDHHSSTSGNTLPVTIDEQNVNVRDTEHVDPELHLDRSTTRVAKEVGFESLSSNSQVVEQGVGTTFQDAHHFSISGNARIVNIGQQNVNNRGTYVLDALEKFVSFSALHDSSAQDPERCCHPGTRQSVLHKMRSWVNDPNAPERILWLHGPAGVGKSAIAQTISHSYGRDSIGATFFFSRSDPVRNDGNRLFPTLAWQLALSVPVVKDRIAFSLKEYPDLPRKAIEAQFRQFIAEPFLTISEDAASTSTRIIVIDGLDECSDVKLQRRILKIIESAVSDPRIPLRFIISSRPEAHIEDFFAQFQHPTLQIDLANVDEAYRDIKTYFTAEFARIAVEQELDPEVWPGWAIVDALVSKSSGQFVYASTVIKCVGDEYENAVEQLYIIFGLKPSTGKSPFSELDALYTEILQRQPDKKFLKDFLAVIVACSALSLELSLANLHEDYAILLGLDEKGLHRKLRGMHSLLKSKPFIDIHHKSFLDFLEDSSRSGEHHVSKDLANRRYLELITDLLVKAASRAMEQPIYHDGDHFKPEFVTVIKSFPLPIELALDDLEKVLRPLLIIQEHLLQLPNMSVPWKPRACDECRTFYIIDGLLLHLAWFRGTTPLQKPKYVGIRPLTAVEEEQDIPQLNLDTCLSLLLAKISSVESQLSLDIEMIGLVRALLHFHPTETAMKIRSIADAQNLIELIFCLNKNECFKSWFGVVADNATRLAVAIIGRVPLLPRSLFLNSANLNHDEETYQGKAVKICNSSASFKQKCFDAFMWGSLSHGNIGPLLGISSFESNIVEVFALPENSAVDAWRRTTNPSVSKVQQIFFEVARTIQYIHSLDIMLSYPFDERDVYLDSDNHVKLQCPGFCPKDLRKEQFDYDGYDDSTYTLDDDIYWLGAFFYEILFNRSYQGAFQALFNADDDDDDDEVTFNIRPREPGIPDNVWQLIQWCCADDPEERPTMDQVVQEMESWISLGQFTLSS